MGNYYTVKQGSLHSVEGVYIDTFTVHGVVVVLVMVDRTPTISGRTEKDAQKAYDACEAAGRTQHLIDVIG
tara:strand:+ start:1393 stop:1605 length:213 start_codon:yes stop_codon:yes gene_type:complete